MRILKVALVIGLLGLVSATPGLCVNKVFDGKDFLQSKFSYDSSDNLEYIGHASPNALTSESKWQIQKINYDSSGNVTSISMAEGSEDFNFVWDDRETYTYP